MNRQIIMTVFKAIDSELGYLYAKQMGYMRLKQQKIESYYKVSDRELQSMKLSNLAITFLILTVAICVLVFSLSGTGGFTKFIDGTSKTIMGIVLWIRSFDYNSWIPYFVDGTLVMFFFFSIADTTQRTMMVLDLDLMSPLFSLPIDFQDVLIAFLLSILRTSWLMILLSFPFALCIFIATGSLLSFIAFAVYIGATIFVFSGAAFYLATFVKLTRFGGSTTMATIRRTLSSIILILVTLLTFLPRVPGITEAFLPVIDYLIQLGKQFWIFYPFVVSESILRLASGLDLVSILLMALYGTLSYLVFSISFGRYWTQLQGSQFPGSAISKPLVVTPRAILHNPISASVVKDLELISRDPRIIQMALGPLLAYVFLIFSLGPAVRPYGNLLVALSVGGTMLFEAILVPLSTVYLVAAEGKALWIASTLPLKKSNLALSKTLTTLLVFSLYAIPISAYLAVTYTVYVVPLAIYFLLLTYSMSLWMAGDALVGVRDIAAVTFKPTLVTYIKLCLLIAIINILSSFLWFVLSMVLKGVVPYLDTDYISLWIFPVIGLIVSWGMTDSTSSTLVD